MTTATAPTAEAARRDAPIPMTRLLKVEARKTFDTRAGFWLMISVVGLALIATVAVILFAPDDVIQFSTFAAAIGTPLGLVLPVLAILSVTSEWSQRTGLVSFTLEPRRGRLILAKALVSVIVAVVSIVVALVIGALGNVVGSAINGTDAVWDTGFAALVNITLGNVLGLLMGFVFGVVFRSSAAAIVGYFAWAFVLTTITNVLAQFQDWFADLQLWVDFGTTQGLLFGNDQLSGEEWAQLGTSGFLWLVLPLLFGTWAVMRSEVK